MAEKEHLTNKERRALAREERKRKEEEAAKRRKRNQVRNGLVTFVIVGVIAAVVLQAFLGGAETIDDTILLASDEVAAAYDEAGCEILAVRDPLPDRYHFEASQAPHPSTIYPEIRPTHSGPHTTGVHPVTASASSQISEVSTTHNLEHGSIIVWWDPEQIDRSTASDIGTWAETLNANGFRSDVGGVGIITAPYEDPGISSGRAIALRAWGTAVDCDEWNDTAGMGFVLEHFGMHGIGPERNLAPFPSHVLDWADRDATEPSDDDAPIGEMDQEDVEELSDEELADLDG